MRLRFQGNQMRCVAKLVAACRPVIFLPVAAALGFALAQNARADQRIVSSDVPRLMSASKGSVHALVIGIDKYQFVKSLRGAVADALDLASTLKRAGVTDLTLLLDEQATRAAIQNALQGLADRTAPNDVVIITYAGHGAQEQARNKASEPDGLDEFFVLPGFNTKGEGTKERILDDEMFGWIGKIAAKKTQTLFLADSCHGGGMSKGVDPRAGGQSVRALTRVDRPELANDTNYYIAPNDDQLDLDVASAGSSDDATTLYPSLTFIAAVDDRHLAPELKIAGEASMRGAASYVTARAFEGLADAEGNRDGVTSRRELLSFVRRHVRMLSTDRQLPVGEPRSADVAMLLTDTPQPAPPAKRGDEAIKAEVAETEPAAAAKQTTSSPADIYFDKATGDVIDHAGTVLAYAAGEASLPVISARVSTFAELNKLAQGRALDISLIPEDRVFDDGERFMATSGDMYGSYLIILNLAGNGEVQYLFPAGNVDSMFQKDKLEIPLKAETPFGTDTLIVIASKERRTELELQLRLLGGKRAPREMFDAVAANLGPEDRIGIASYSTKPKP